MNEVETRAELIDPLLTAAGWGVVEGSRIRREFAITPGRLEGGGRHGKSLTADDVLVYRNTQLAVVDAFPTPQQLWERTFAEQNAWRDRFAAIPDADKGGSWQIRFYQEIAASRALWSAPDTRTRLLQGLAEMQAIIAAEHSDLFDVLAHVAQALPPIPRESRAQQAAAVSQLRAAARREQRCAGTGPGETRTPAAPPLPQLDRRCRGRPRPAR